MPRDTTYYDDNTLDVVYEVLDNYTHSRDASIDAVIELLNTGILFRERYRD